MEYRFGIEEEFLSSTVRPWRRYSTFRKGSSKPVRTSSATEYPRSCYKARSNS